MSIGTACIQKKTPKQVGRVLETRKTDESVEKRHDEAWEIWRFDV